MLTHVGVLSERESIVGIIFHRCRPVASLDHWGGEGGGAKKVRGPRVKVGGGPLTIFWRDPKFIGQITKIVAGPPDPKFSQKLAHDFF